MAIAVDATSSWTDGGLTQDPYTSGSFTPPNLSKIFVCASSFAQSGDDSSIIQVSGTVLTWAAVTDAHLDQLTNGAACAAPPIGFWTATGTGASITVTQECIDGLGFSHVQGIWVLTGAGSVIDVGTFTGLGAASISLDATAAGQIALFGMIDWDNNADTPAKSNASMTTRKAGFTAGEVQAHYLGDFFTTGSGAFSVGTNVLGSPQGTNAVAILIDAAASSTNANAGSAAGAGTVSAASAAVAPSAGSASAAAAGNAVTASVAPSGGLASAAAQAGAVTTAISVSAGHASSSAEAGSAQAGIAPSSGVAPAVAAALAPSISVSVNAGLAAATATANGATTAAGNIVYAFAGLASATATAWRGVARRTVTRPFTGTVTRPFTGTVTRP